MTWSTVFSFASHSQTAEEAIPICTSRSGNVRHRCGGGEAIPSLFLGGSLRGVGDNVGDENAESCGVVRTLRVRILLIIRPVRRLYVVVVR